MIDQFEVDQPQRIRGAAGEEDVFTGWRRIAGGMVVVDHHADGVDVEAVAHDVAGGDDGVGHRADVDLALADDAAAGVEEDGAELLLPQAGAACDQRTSQDFEVVDAAIAIGTDIGRLPPGMGAIWWSPVIRGGTARVNTPTTAIVPRLRK